MTIDLPAIRDRAAAFEAAYKRIAASSYRPLLCDDCGALHADDNDALSESCDCGRFKQRMEHATTREQAGRNAKDITTLAADVRGLYERVEELERANDLIGSWLSAALDDETACAEFKAAVAKWFEVQNPQPRGRDE